jgi:Uma2 family endonuclease
LAKPLPLVPGDHLTRSEFERRYQAMPGVKAELIDGVVYMPPPVRTDQHGAPQFDLITWLGAYRVATPGVTGADNSTVRLDSRGAPQPDVMLRIDPACGGATIIDDEGYTVGAPELVVEIAASSASYDLHEKLEAFRKNGVKEYLVWRVLDSALDWFVLRRSQYERFAPNSVGLLCSEVFPGLWLDPEALLRGDLATVMRRLQEGIAGQEHAEFVQRLAMLKSEHASRKEAP